MNREFQPEENIIVTISCSYTNSEILIRILIFEQTLLLRKETENSIACVFFISRSLFSTSVCP